MEQQPPPRAPRTMLLGLIILLAVAGGAAYLLFDTPSPQPPGPSPTAATLPGLLTSAAPWPPNAELLAERLDAIGLPALTAEGQVVHIHPTLEIAIDGNPVPIPAQIGIHPSGTFLAPIHTHDDSGTIHVESPEPRRFSLGQFFDVWGIRFDRRCLGPYCTEDGGRLLVLIGDEDVTDEGRSLRLRDGQRILVLYESP